MRTQTKKKLEAAGFRVGDAAEFLGLAKIEDTMVDLKVALADTLRVVRERQRLTQAQLAKRVRSSQSRVAKKD